MSKAIEGAALLGADAALYAGLVLGTGGMAIALAPIFNMVAMPLLQAGLSMEAGAIASALTGNRGMGVTTRAAAAYRQIVYGGDLRVPGISIYESTTGSSADQYNYIIVLSGHEIDSIPDLWLDGRKVYWQGSGAGWSVRNGVGFGGIANGNTYTGPDGNRYNFGGTGHSGIYAEARYGDQLPGDVIGGLTANDPNYAADGLGNSPWVAGCAYIYLKVEYNPTVFPNAPEIRVSVKGKNNIWDPRNNTRGWSCNAALCIADAILDTQFGVGDLEAFQDAGSLAQLIAAANICDEQVAVEALASSGTPTESRYSVHYKCDAATPPGNMIDAMLPAMGGRISQPGGEWYLYPAAWIGPSFTFGEGVLAGAIKWEPYRSQKDLCNRVLGTYTAPGFPWNIAGNLYNTNGFYDGHIQNNFNLADQPTDYPPYAADPLHGYAADEYLNGDSELLGAWASGTAYNQGDVASLGSGTSLVMYKSLIASNVGHNPATSSFPGGGAAAWNSGTTYAAGTPVVYAMNLYVALTSTTGNTPSSSPTDWAICAWIPYANLLPKQLNLPTVQSVTQAQRLAKIELLRNRYQGSGDMPTMQAAFVMDCCSVMEFTSPTMGWTSKILEIAGVKSVISEATPGGDRGPTEDLDYHVAETDPSIYEWDPTTEELTIYDVAATPTQQSRTVAPPTGLSLTSSAATALVSPTGVATPRIEVEWTTPADVLATGIQMQHQLAPGGVATGPWIDDGTVDVALNVGYVAGIVAGGEYNVQIRSVRSASGATSAWVQQLNYTASLTLSSSAGLYAVGAGSLNGIAIPTGGAEIVCNPFTATIGQLALSIFPAGAVTLTGLAQQTGYYVYYVDPTNAGGNVTPIATTNAADFLGKPGYWLIDSIVTPFAATGVSTRYAPTIYTDTGSVNTRSPGNAFDGNLSTIALVWARSGGEVDIVYGGFPNIILAGASTLTAVVAVIAAPDFVITGYIGGVATVILNATVAAAQTSYTLTIPAGTNLSTVSIEFDTTTGNGDIAEIYIQT